MIVTTGEDPSTGMPTPADLLGDALPEVVAVCQAHVGLVTGISRLTGGNVSHVFRVEGARGSVILKVRTAVFARIPSLRTDPAFIADERRALDVYGALVPSVFPRVLAFRPQAHAMVMTDVFPDRRTYEDCLHERPATVDELMCLGAMVRRIHEATKDVQVAIRSQGDLWFRDHTFDYCLRGSGHPALDMVCEELRAQAPQQLVLGDLAPKNLSIADGRVTLCDLDNVHRSRPLFDVGYLLAHLLIHHVPRPNFLPALAPTLLDAYYADHPLGIHEGTLLAAVAAGVILYRLDNPMVPYVLRISAEQRGRLREALIRLLDRGTFAPVELAVAVAGAA
ncbi:aminoglycoside phosphotransferase family protein [Streptomyces erythrochromogenes]|uniref:hypothetical protein n=1 Tax=Streptomyces erythrochromogenes TaxID=285574 RepID=UPI0036A6CA7A